MVVFYRVEANKCAALDRVGHVLQHSPPCKNTRTGSKGAGRWFVSAALMSTALTMFLSRLTAEIDVGDAAAVVGMALVLSLQATLSPCWRAARLDPVKARRSAT
jgi:hypothetical protein